MHLSHRASLTAAYSVLPDAKDSNPTGVLAMAIPPEFIEDLRQRVPLSDIIGRRVKLIRKGRRFSGLCPFHSEKLHLFQLLMMMVFIIALDAERMVMPFHFA